MDESKSFWNWGGRYVGYRASDCLFSFDGRQIGYFAEGDEVYGCTGDYLGEIRGDSRLIVNLSKQAWSRKTVVPRVFKTSTGQRDLDAKVMLAGFKDFPAPSDNN